QHFRARQSDSRHGGIPGDLGLSACPETRRLWKTRSPKGHATRTPRAGDFLRQRKMRVLSRGPLLHRQPDAQPTRRALLQGTGHQRFDRTVRWRRTNQDSCPAGLERYSALLSRRTVNDLGRHRRVLQSDSRHKADSPGEKRLGGIHAGAVKFRASTGQDALRTMNTRRDFLNLGVKGSAMAATAALLPQAWSAQVDTGDGRNMNSMANSADSNSGVNYKPCFRFGL